jgi:hypothetical protein
MPDLEPNNFALAWSRYITAHYGEMADVGDGADIISLSVWTMLSNRGVFEGPINPVGFVFGRSRPTLGVLQIESVVFAPWIGTHTRYYAWVGFWNWLKANQMKAFAFVPADDRRIFDAMMKLLIVRRIGTSTSILGTRAPVFETRL